MLMNDIELNIIVRITTQKVMLVVKTPKSVRKITRHRLVRQVYQPMETLSSIINQGWCE